MQRRIVVIGATSMIAQHCVRLWTREASAHVILAGRDIARLERTASDLRVRSPGSSFDVHAMEFFDPERIAAGVDDICAGGIPHIVLIAHGTLPDQGQCQDDLAVAAQALQANALSPALFAEAFAKHLEKAGRGTLVLIGSVAGDRGRRKNYVYGAAKALVGRYAEGLQHRFAGTGVKVVLAKPGPTDTPMTAHLPKSSLASAESVARDIVAAARQGRPVVYAPAKWRLIMLVLRHLPRFVFDKLDI